MIAPADNNSVTDFAKYREKTLDVSYSGGGGVLPPGNEPPHGGDGGGDLEGRIRKLETDGVLMSSRMDAMREDMNRRFDDLGKKIDKLPTEWGMAKIVFFVMAAMMAAAMWGPRLLGSIALPPSP